MRIRHIAFFIVALATSFMLAVTFHDFRSVDLTLIPSAARSGGKVLLFGNSINRTISHCDDDVRTIPDMLADLGGPAVVNVSRGGMPFSQMLRMAELVTQGGARPSAIVFPVLFGDLLQLADAPYGFASFTSDNLPRQLMSHKMPSSSPPDIATYRGRYYGSYAVFSKTHFEQEKRQSGCPASMGVDRDFVEFMYWRNYLQPSDPLTGLDRTITRVNSIKRKGINIVFWFPPINFEDIEALHGRLAADSIRQRTNNLMSALTSQSFSVFDTTSIVPASGFADRWCACGHLNQLGRVMLTRRLHEDVTRLDMAGNIKVRRENIPGTKPL